MSTVLGLIWAQTLPDAAGRAIIGRDGGLPWHLPEDLAHFRAVTNANPVIMGRSTWESLPTRFRPLPGRANIVLTRTVAWSAPGARVAATPTDALAGAGAGAWVIGGAQVYRSFLDLATRIEVTEIDLDLGDPRADDVLAPTPSGNWTRAQGEWLIARNGLRYRFVSLTRDPGPGSG